VWGGKEEGDLWGSGQRVDFTLLGETQKKNNGRRDRSLIRENPKKGLTQKVDSNQHDKQSNSERETPSNKLLSGQGKKGNSKRRT